MINNQEKFNVIYTDVSNSISSALSDIESLDVKHNDGKRAVSNITEQLRIIQNHFNEELGQLKNHAEWDKFTLAFFGETNAGKSTIIESLRILFDEESRQELLRQNAENLEQFERALTEHLEHVREGLFTLYSEYTDELASIMQSIAQLRKQTELQEKEHHIAQLRYQAEQQEKEQNIAQLRNQIEQQETEHSIAQLRSQTEQQETVQHIAQLRNQIEQQETEHRLQLDKAYGAKGFKIRLALFGLGGILIGTAVTLVLLKLIGT